MTEVVAAMIWENGRFLLCRRPGQKARGGFWEFPGGKVEPGESSRQALSRECREELGVELEVLAEAAYVAYEYPELEIGLTLFNARLLSGRPRLLEHSAMSWAAPEEAAALELCPADRLLLEKLFPSLSGTL